MFNFKYTSKHLKNWTGCYYYNRWSILGMQNMITGMIERGNEKDAYKNMYDREMKWVTYENRNEWEKKTTKMLIANSSLGKSFYPLSILWVHWYTYWVLGSDHNPSDDLQLYNPLADQPPWHPHSIPDSLGQASSNDPQGQATYDITHRTCWARIHHQSNNSEITGHSKSAVDDYELPVVPTFILFDTSLRGVSLSKRTWHYL